MKRKIRITESELVNVIKRIIKESERDDLLNQILDKISEYGMDSLTSYEKSLLDKLSKEEKTVPNKKEESFDFLNKRYSNLTPQTYQSDKIGKKVLGVKYFDKNGDMIFDLEVEAEVLGIQKPANTLYTSESIYNDLRNNFDMSDSEIEETVKEWFKSFTELSVSKIGFMF